METMNAFNKFKDVLGYEGRYACSREGEVYSFLSNQMLTPNISHGYARLQLVDMFGSKKNVPVHRIIHNTYSLGKYQINHKDENRLNNHVNNLELCTAKYNNNYGNHIANLSNSCRRDNNLGISKTVLCVNTGERFASSHEAERFYGLTRGVVNSCCRKNEDPNRKYDHYTLVNGEKFYWKYINGEDQRNPF